MWRRTDTALNMLSRYAMFASTSFLLSLVDLTLTVTVETFESPAGLVRCAIFDATPETPNADLTVTLGTVGSALAIPAFICVRPGSSPSLMMKVPIFY